MGTYISLVFVGWLFILQKGMERTSGHAVPILDYIEVAQENFCLKSEFQKLSLLQLHLDTQEVWCHSLKRVEYCEFY